MKRRTAFACTVLLISAALFWSERRKVDAPVGPEPIVNLIADTERELTRLPVAFAPLADAEEIKIGEALEKFYARRWRESDTQNRGIENYLQQLGARLAAGAHRKLPYRFHYVAGLDFINAFALPGGPVFIGAGLMALMETEDELAAVLGHEIEHIDHYHCAERVQVQAALRRVPLGELVRLPLEIFVAGYSKSQEMEADREGARLAVKAAYSPEGAIQMFEAFDRVHPTKAKRAGAPQEELSEVARKTLEGYFRSHPMNAERIDQIRKMIAARQLPASVRTRRFPLAYVFLAGRAQRSLEAALSQSHRVLAEREKRRWEADQVKQFERAAQLASQSLTLQPDWPQSLQILAVAQFGLGNYPLAGATYRKLLPQHPAFADGVRLFAEALATQALKVQEYAKAAKLASELLRLQPDQATALKILAQAQVAVADFTAAGETSRKLRSMYPDTADEVRAYVDRLAASHFGENRYLEAARLATHSLELKPDQPELLAILAKSQFALAEFSAAAAAYRRLLDQNPSDIGLAHSYTDALAAGKPARQAAGEFETWLARAKPAAPALTAQLRIEMAGLKLMAGNEAPAKDLIAQAQGPDRGAVAPEFLGRLGWWYYRAGNHAASAALLEWAVQQRPGDLGLQSSLAWSQLEQHKLEDAIRGFTSSAGEKGWHSPLMGRAVARWQSRQSEEALRDFEAVGKNFPQWLSPRWVKALYPPSVARSVAEMQAEWPERQKRQAALRPKS